MQTIIFMGTPAFAATVLESLVTDYQILAVVTQPDRPVGRKQILTPPPVKEVALAHQLPVYQPEKLSQSPELDTLIQLQADWIVTAAYGQKLPNHLIDSAKIAAVNVHASLLPKYRGGAPLHYALWKGESQTGVTIMSMVEEMDAGLIYSQKALPITDQDDVGALFEKTAILGSKLLRETLPQIASGQLQGQAQDPTQVVFSPTITKDQEALIWQETARQVDQHIRGFRPFPTTYTLMDEDRVKIWQAQVWDQPLPQNHLSDQEPGTIVAYDAMNFWVQCGEGTYLKVEVFQPAGKKKMPVADFLKGCPGSTLLGKKLG